MIEQSLRVSQVQQQRLSPQMIQTLKILHLSTFDLEQVIRSELNSNPALELDPGSQHDASRKEFNAFTEHEIPYDLEHLFSHTTAEAPIEHSQELALYNTGVSLYDHMLPQLEHCELTSKEKQLARILISNLDSNGFHIIDPENFKAGYSYASFKHTLEELQGLDPIGTAVSNFQESLVVQAKHHEQCPLHLEAFIYELFPHSQGPTAQSLELSDQERSEYMQFLQSLNPFPGKQFSLRRTNYINPDAEVTVEDQKVGVRFFRSKLPNLRLNQRFLHLSEKDSGARIKTKEQKSELQFARRYVSQGKQFLHSLELREQTSERVIRRVVDHQEAYFLRGMASMRVLKINDLALDLELSASTISRIANTRYIRCPQGIYLLRFFFSLGTTTKLGSVARIGIKHMIQTILEQSSTRLSDERIRSHLQGNGISIARRTVAKYRKELGILKQTKRR